MTRHPNRVIAPHRPVRDTSYVDPLAEAMLRRAEVLSLALRDFWDVGICADYLLDAGNAAHQLKSRVRIALETGMLVTYARPFSGKSGRTISPASDLSPILRGLHDDIILRRNKVYAHTDYTDFRQIVNLRSDGAISAFIADDDETLNREVWDYLSDEGLLHLGKLSQIHYTQSHAELDQLRERLAELQRSQPDDKRNSS